MNDHRDIQVIKKIISEMEFLSSMILNLDYEYFNNDEILKRAVAMTIINIGELTRLLSDEFKESHSEIPFKEMTATRNVAAHGYQTLRMADIWQTVTIDIPKLKEDFIKLIQQQQREVLCAN